MKSKIHLIRHGITDGNRNRWYYGSMDIPLNDEGIDGLIGFWKEGIYPEMNGGKFFTSGKLRTEQTLFLLYGEVEHEKLEALQEMNFGIFEGHSYDELKENFEFCKWIESHDSAAPGGESRTQFRNRVHEGLKELFFKHALNKGEDDSSNESLIICHGGVISVIMMKVLDDAEKNFYDWIPAPGRGYTLFLNEYGSVTDYEEI